MIKNISFFLAFSLLLLTCSCNNSIDNNNDQLEKNATETRALPQKGSEVESEEASMSYLVRKWEFGEEYIDLKREGAFEAVLEGKHIKGRWGLSQNTAEKQTLKLIGKEVQAETKSNSFNKTYELIDVSFDRLVAIDAEGNKIHFFAGE